MRRGFLLGLKRPLSAILAYVVCVGPVVATTSEVLHGRHFSAEPAPIQTDSKSDSLFIQAVQNSEGLPPFDLSFSSNDPLVDEDPFFLRSQSWDDSGNWTLNAPLHEFASTENFLFYSAKSANLFNDKSAGGPNQGIFFVERSELNERKSLQAAVPVYFFPLPEGNWIGDLEALEFSSASLLALKDASGSVIPLYPEDLESMASVQRANLQLGLLETVQSHARDASILTQEGIYPAARSIAGFGLAYVGSLLNGLEIGRPNSFTEIEKESSIGSELLKLIGIRPVYAEGVGATPEQLARLAEHSAELTERLIRISAVLCIALAGSIALRYTVYKKTIDGRRAAMSEAERAHWKSRWGLLQTREVLDVYAHLLTLIYQIPTITLANVVEFSLDRYFPRYAASENTWVRKFLNRTVLYARASIEKVPVNWRTWFLGAIVLGGIDTLFVGVQLYHVVPAVGEAVGDNIPALKTRTDAAFELGNPLIESFNRNEVMRNLFMYAASGAASFSADLKGQLEQVLAKEVDDRLKAQGKDLTSERVKAERKEILETQIELAMKRLGLPGSDEFLFDFLTFYEKAYGFLGYRMPGSEGSNLIGQNRPGLLLPALNRTIAYLEKRGDYSAQGALRVLREVRAEAGSFRNFLGDFNFTPEGLKQKKASLQRARQSLLSLTYRGDFYEEVQQLPLDWGKYGSEDAYWAATYFRRGFASVLKGDDSLLNGPADFDLNQVRLAEEAAYQDLRKRNLEKSSLEKWALINSQQGEFQVLTEAHLQRITNEDRSAKEVYHPTQDSLLTRLQKQSIRERTDAVFSQEGGIFESAQGQARWKSIYREVYLKTVGLFPDYEHHPELIETVKTQAEVSIQKSINDPKFVVYLESLDSRSREEVRMSRICESEVALYIEATVRQDSIHPLDPAQPGRLQKLRQSDILRKDFGGRLKLLTRGVRAVEALWAEAEYNLGGLPWLYRNVPLSFDLVKSIDRSLRRLPIILTSSFAFNLYFWGADITWAQWLFFGLTSFTIAGPAQTLNRLFTFQNWKPMGSIKTTALLAFLHTWATFWGSVPMYIFAGDFMKAWPYMAAAVISGPVVISLAKSLTRSKRQKVADFVFDKVSGAQSFCRKAISGLAFGSTRVDR